MDLGWIDKQDLPEYHGEIEKPYWEWLTRCRSQYLSFEDKDGYSADWNDGQRSLNRKNLIAKLQSGDLDLVIAMGTWAGLDLANNEHGVPVMVLSTSDPVRSGIIASNEDSGYEHVTARVDPNRYGRQIRMFSRIVGFETLGVAYENTPDGRVFSAVEKIRQVAEERDFKVVLCEVEDTNTDADISDRSCFECYRRLAESVDAVYVTALSCVDRQMEEIAEIFRDARVPSFSMTGSLQVKQGVMLSISNDSGYRELGKYNAMKFGEILNGTRPGKLNQLFEDPLDIAINMETVRQTGFEMPESILRIAREVYEE